ncbi:MAG: T9SS type A sorting domain-containing protein [Bacteroidia bacterium]
MKTQLLFALILIFTSHISIAQVTIILDKIPENTPKEDPIHIAGDFQGWNPASQDYVFAIDSVTGLHVLTMYFVEGEIEFKFARGSWDKVESTENGGFRPNREAIVAAGDTLELEILGWEDLDGNGGGNSTAAANVQILTDSFYIPQLKTYRRVWIYLPPDYNETSHNYPVLYMHDGQNVFDAKTSFAGEWKVDETLNELHAKGDSGIIVVAIDNGGSNRTAEYTPWENTQYGGGDGSEYVDFLVKELVPYINTNYRTLATPRNTGIMGSSLGGLISTYAAVKYPDVFGRVGSFSPAYWINPEIFDLEYKEGSLASTKFYQIAGNKESETMVSNMMKMHDSLKSHGVNTENIESIAKTDGAHSEWFWAREFEDAYLFLFRNRPSSLEQPNLTSYYFEIFPNPTQSVINIRIAAQERGQITATLVDVNGKLIAPLINDTIEAGVKHFHFNKGQFAIEPGIYFVRIESEGAIKTKKVTILE